MKKLKDLISKDNNKEITPSLIIDVVAEHLHVSIEEILSSKRTADIVRARHIAMYLCSSLISNTTTTSIGSFFGKRDHSTASSAIKNIKEEIKTNNELASTIETIKKKIIPS